MIDDAKTVFFRNYSPIDVSGQLHGDVIATRNSLRFLLISTDGDEQLTKAWLSISPSWHQPKWLPKLRRLDIYGNIWIGNFIEHEAYGAAWTRIDTRLQGFVMHEEKILVFRVLNDRLKFTRD